MTVFAENMNSFSERGSLSSDGKKVLQEGKNEEASCIQSNGCMAGSHLEGCPEFKDEGESSNDIESAAQSTGRLKLGIPRSGDIYTDWDSGTSLPTSGKYKLITNVTLSESVKLTGDLILDLNGYTVTATTGKAIVSTGYALTIEDLSLIHI